MAVDIKTNPGVTITDDKSHDSKFFVSLVKQSKKFRNVVTTLADGAYDTRQSLILLL